MADIFHMFRVALVVILLSGTGRGLLVFFFFFRKGGLLVIVLVLVRPFVQHLLNAFVTIMADSLMS